MDDTYALLLWSPRVGDLIGTPHVFHFSTRASAIEAGAWFSKQDEDIKVKVLRDGTLAAEE